MNSKQLSETLNLKIFNAGDGFETEPVLHVYTCDLLSFAMSKAQANDAWITVMGNVNSVAVASLTDVSCIVLSDNVNPDEDALNKAKENGITVLGSSLPAFETALSINNLLK